MSNDYTFLPIFGQKSADPHRSASTLFAFCVHFFMVEHLHDCNLGVYSKVIRCSFPLPIDAICEI